MERRKESFDLNACVRRHQWQACQNPLYSIFREESTRQFNSIAESRAGVTKDGPSTLDAYGRWLYFPFRNNDSIKAGSFPPPDGELVSIALVGAEGPLGKFVAEQYLQRGIGVTVLTRDLDEAKALLVPIADGSREQRHKASMGFVSLARGASSQPQLVAAEEAECDPAVRGGCRVLRYQYTGVFNQCTRTYTLELVEGATDSSEDVQYALRRASLVYWLPSASEVPRGRTSISGRGTRTCSIECFHNVLDACRRVDGHLVLLTPSWTRGSWTSPLYWYRRLFGYPRGYCRAVREQEAALLSPSGEIAPMCYCGSDDGAPFGRSPLRFSIFRLADITYPCFNDRLLMARNNCIDDVMKVVAVHQGNLPARLLANVMAKSLGLCKSVVGSRIDCGGALRGGVDMKSVEAVFDQFSKFKD